MFHCASEATLSEAAEVLTRPTVLKRLKMTKARVEEFVESVRDNSTVLIAVPHRFNFPRDPDDEPLIDLAIEADAQFLVTWDKDLLDLMEPENADGQTLKAQAPNLRIVAPPELLRTLRAAQIPE